MVFIAQEILVDHASYPTQRIAANSHKFRPLGLGYSNLGSLIMAAGAAYDSDEARGMCGAVTALLHGAACRASAELAAAVGPFEGYEDNREPMLHVMEMHWDAVEQIHNCPNYLQAAARQLWDDVLVSGRRHGFRNAQATVLAPTGTISFMMDCDTTGIEPDIALVKYKQLAGGGMLKIVNNTVPLALRTLGYDEPQIEVDRQLHRRARHDRRRAGFAGGAPAGVRLRVPGLARHALDSMEGPRPHDGGRAAVHLRGHFQDGEHAQGGDAGGYRPGLHGRLAAGAEGAGHLSRRLEGSAAAFDTKKADKTAKRRRLAPRRERLPDTRQSITHKFNIAGHEGYITVGLYPDGRPGELFITMAKEGSTIGGLMDCFGTAVSMSLQYGVPLEVYVNKFSHTRFEPMGLHQEPRHPHRQERGGLHLPLAGDHVPARLRRDAESPARLAHRGRASAAERRGRIRTGAFARRHEGRRAGVRARCQGAGGQGPVADRNPQRKRGNETQHERCDPKRQRGQRWIAQRPRAHNGNGAGLNGGHGTNGTNGAGGNAANGHAPMAAKRSAVAASAPIRFTATVEPHSAYAARHDQFASFQTDAPSCDRCGSITARAGNCYLCYNCGNSMGCS